MTWQVDMQCQLKETSKNLVAYSIATDESRDIDDNVHFTFMNLCIVTQL